MTAAIAISRQNDAGSRTRSQSRFVFVWDSNGLQYKTKYFQIESMTHLAKTVNSKSSKNYWENRFTCLRENHEYYQQN